MLSVQVRCPQRKGFGETLALKIAGAIRVWRFEFPAFVFPEGSPEQRQLISDPRVAEKRSPEHPAWCPVLYARGEEGCSSRIRSAVSGIRIDS